MLIYYANKCIAPDFFFSTQKVMIFFLFLNENMLVLIDTSNKYPQHTFLWRNKNNKS